MGPFGIAGETSTMMAVAQYVVGSTAALGTAFALHRGISGIFFRAEKISRRSTLSPIKAVEADGTVIHANGRLSKVFNIQGYDASLTSTEVEERLAQTRAEWIATMANHKVELRILSAKLNTDPPVVPLSEAPLFRVLGQRQFEALAPFYRKQIHVIITTKATEDDARTDLDAATRDTASGLLRFGAEPLTPETGCMNLLAAYMSPATRPVISRGTSDLPLLLNADTFESDMDKGCLKFTGPTGRVVYAISFTLARLGDEADTELLPALMSLPWENVVSQCVLPATRGATMSVMDVKARFAKQHKSQAVDSQLAAHRDQQVTRSGSNPLTKWGLHLVVFTGQQSDFPRIEALVHEKCSNHAIYPMRERVYCKSAYEAAIPGQDTLTPTPRDITARQVATFAPLALSFQGHARNEWLPHPVMYLKDASGGVFGLNFHATADDSMPSAHTKFIGVPGTGKTALANWTAVQVLANLQMLVIHIDNEKAAYPIIRSLGSLGAYHDLSNRGGTNPCQRADNAENRRHLSRILALIIGRGTDVKPAVQDWIDRAVEMNFSPLTPLRLRNLRHLAEIGFPGEIDGISEDEQAARKILMNWINGPSGRLLTADDDSMAIDGARMVGIDLGPLKEDPLNAALMLSDIVNMTRDALVRARRPVVFCVDETKYYTAIPGMVSVIEGLSDTIRRQGGAVWTLWQRPQQIVDAGMLSVMRAAPTTIAFAHPDTPADEYVEYLGFSVAEAGVLNLSNPAALALRRPALIKQGSTVAIVDCDLSSIGKGPLQLLSGLKGKDRLDQLDLENPATAVARFIGEDDRHVAA